MIITKAWAMPSAWTFPRFNRNWWCEIVKERRTFGKYYPAAGANENLCDSCVNNSKDCTWEGRIMVRCPDYIKGNEVLKS
jgi:hypothetical protein